jgi:hypothetical protein
MTDLRDHMKPPKTVGEWMERETADPAVRADLERCVEQMRAEQDQRHTTGIVAWKMGRNFSMWHITRDDLWTTLCGVAVPTKPLDNVSRIRGRDRSPTCGSCLAKIAQMTRETLKVVR